MDTKTCPSCGEQVPSVATRCKHCFYDFTEEPAKKGMSGLMGLLLLVAVLAVVGAGTFYWLSGRNVTTKAVADEQARMIFITKKSVQGTSTESVDFDDVARIEYVVGGDRDTFEVAVITTDGRRVLYNYSDQAIKGDAQTLSEMTGKPLTEINNIEGFGDPTPPTTTTPGGSGPKSDGH